MSVMETEIVTLRIRAGGQIEVGFLGRCDYDHFLILLDLATLGFRIVLDFSL